MSQHDDQMNENSPDFEALLDYVKQSRGFDFTGYKRPSLMRRVNKRMQGVGVETYSRYLDYLEVHPEEFHHLFNTLLINVTSFFRNRPTWEYVESDILPRILSRKIRNEPIRVWSCGCASGEETYTIAILLAELLGLEQYRERVKIYATDVDEEALTQARHATYPAKDLASLTPAQLEQFFTLNENDTYTFSKDLRRSVIFGRHDLIQDAPISKVDLLTCRNTLMYFNLETQSRILSRFHFALQEAGFLLLGKAEMLLTHSNLFTPVNLKYRLFTRVSQLLMRDRLLGLYSPGHPATNPIPSNQQQLREVAFDSSPLARIVIDNHRLLALCNEAARRLFQLSAQDIGRPLQDLELSYRPVELRSCIDQVYRDRRPVHLHDIQWQPSSGDLRFLEIQVTPLFETNNILGIAINFIDITRYKQLQADLEHSNQELEMAYEELQSTNEELETTNEELQSSNEELETTNEELQSTNEELETMNEELQSTNEELQTVNDELQRRSEELNQSNAFLEAILTSLRGGVIVVDRDLRVQIWNHKAEDLWGLRHEEALNQNFLNLDIGLPVENLRQPIRNCLADPFQGASETLVNAINRRGRTILCQVTCTPLMSNVGLVQGVIILTEEQEELNVS